jgi:hypothetical protein
MRSSPEELEKTGRKRFFFEKKRSKKLSLLGAATRSVPQPAVNESFLLLFFKKEALASSYV